MVGIPFRACVFCHLLGSRFWGGRVSHRLKQMAETREPSSLTMCEDIQLHVRAQKKESLSLYFPCPEENAAAAPCHSCRPPLEPHSAFMQRVMMRESCTKSQVLGGKLGLKVTRASENLQKWQNISLYACFLLFMLRSSIREAPPPLLCDKLPLLRLLKEAFLTDD